MPKTIPGDWPRALRQIGVEVLAGGGCQGTAMNAQHDFEVDPQIALAMADRV